MVNELSEVLSAYEVATLQAILTYHGYKAPGPGRLKRAEMIAALAKLLAAPGWAVRAYAALSKPAREVVTVLQRQGGSATYGAIRRRMLDLKLLDAKETRLDRFSNQQPDFRRGDSSFLDEILAYLLANGLVFAHLATDPWGRTNQLTFRVARDYYIPRSILALLPAAPALPGSLPEEAAPAVVIEGSARAFQRDLYLYWSYVYHHKPELIAKGYLAKRHVVAINDVLLQRESISTGQGEADFPRLVFLRVLLSQLGLIRIENGRLLALPGEGFFGAAPQERIRRAFEAYIIGRELNELEWFNTIYSAGATPTNPAPDRVVDARKTLVLFLRLAREWTNLEALLARVRETAYEFFLPRSYSPGSSQSYYYPPSHPYSQYGNPLGWEWGFSPSLDEGEGWRRVEGRWIRWMVEAPFFWMGLVNLGKRAAQGGEVESFSLTTPGRWLMAGGPPPEIPQEGGQVIVQPDFTVLAFDPISDLVLFRLEQFAQRVSAERAILFRMSQASVYAGQQAGWDAARILAYLGELSQQTIPSNVSRTLQEWQSAHERIRIVAHVNLLYAAHPADLAALAEHKKIAALLARPMAAGLVVLPPEKDLGQVHHTLAEAGWWPVITRRSAALPQRAVTVDEQGRLAIVQRDAGLYLRAHLARFAEAQGEGYRLTQASIGRAVRAGQNAAQIIDELNRVLVTPLSPAVERRLLAWSGHFGQAQVEHVTLLRFKNQRALEDLLRDPEIGRLMQAFRPLDLAQVAQVRPKELEKLRALLEERGVEWKDE